MVMKISLAIHKFNLAKVKQVPRFLGGKMVGDAGEWYYGMVLYGFYMGVFMLIFNLSSLVLMFFVWEPHRTLGAWEKQQKRLEHVQQTTTATPLVATIVKLAAQNHWPPADGTWPAWRVQTNIFFEDFEPNQSTTRPAAQRIVSAARWRCIHWVWKHTCSPSWIDTHP